MNKLKSKPLVKKRKNFFSNKKLDFSYNTSVHTVRSDSAKKRAFKTKIGSRKLTYTKETYICYGIGFLVMGGMVGIFSSLIGHTLLEQTRRDQIQIKEKVAHLKKEISHLKGKIDTVKYHENIDKWAESKGMINDRLLQPKTEKIITPDALKDAYVASF